MISNFYKSLLNKCFQQNSSQHFKILLKIKNLQLNVNKYHKNYSVGEKLIENFKATTKFLSHLVAHLNIPSHICNKATFMNEFI